MPKRYEKMRDEFIAQGMDEAKAKKKAARIFNANRGPNEAPVTRREGLSSMISRQKRKRK